MDVGWGLDAVCEPWDEWIFQSDILKKTFEAKFWIDVISVKWLIFVLVSAMSQVSSNLYSLYWYCVYSGDFLERLSNVCWFKYKCYSSKYSDSGMS